MASLMQMCLALVPGLIDPATVDELLFVCRSWLIEDIAEDVGQQYKVASDKAKGDVLRAKARKVSGEARSEMQGGIEEQEKQATQGALSQVPLEPPNGPLSLHPIGTRASLPLHFTIDVDWVHGSESGLKGLLDFCDRWKLKATIFVAGRFAEAHAELIGECRWRGHELGTHGWEHGCLEEDEDFRSASYDQQRKWIRLATDAVEKASGVRPVVFRAPNLWVSETTLRALEDEGYRYDSSVPARRFDCGFGRVHYLKYFRAPSDPYRPSLSHLRLPGESSIIEMAPSAFLLPINMAMLRLLGLPLMKWLVRRISQRASRLVFYCHPYEFVHAKRQSFPRYVSKWNMRSMRPENFFLLDAFVEHMLCEGYHPALCGNSLG